MNLLDRYLFKSVLFSCATAVGLFAFVLTLGNVIRDLLSYILSGRLSLPVAGELIFLTVASVATYALPIGILTGVLLTLGRLSADSEITAMRTSGISLFRIMRPVFLLAAIGMVTALYVNFQSMPAAKIKYERELALAVRTDPLSFIQPKTFIRDFRGEVVYVGDIQNSEMRDIWLWELDQEGRAVRLVRARSGHLDFDSENNELIVTLQDAQLEMRHEKNPEDFSEWPTVAVVGSSQPVHLSLDRMFGRTSVRQKLPWMTYAELKAEQARLAAEPVAPADARQHERDEMKVTLTIQEKFTTAVAVLSFALLGIPLGIKVSRRETSANLGVAVLLALGYYFLTTAVSWIDRHPEYRPDLLLWLPNVICLSLGIWLFSRIERH
ncbi:MAG TPA: LptF/LptG family permease [Opitutaceae bacterium]|nr:LptF/LptG family permease [Lacunisphaera sp.]HWA09209.1 LptF/LptG family permease [Opitutaceae bacterium]